MTQQRVAVLGSTGSIGRSTLDVLQRHPDRFVVQALTAHNDWRTLFQQCQEFRPAVAVMADITALPDLVAAVRAAGLPTQVLGGAEALVAVAASAEVDTVMAAIVGAAGLPSALAAARAGKRLLLANKESLVMGGQLFMDAVREGGAVLLPIDSEHNAIFQCLPAAYRCGDALPAAVRRVVLTASGGPFRGWTQEQLRHVTPAQACVHPNWSMGRKISVDSATLMNKGLEVLEACWLFGVGEDQVEVVVHPQSVVHSLVSYADGSVLAELGQPDMRTAIACGLSWPERMDAGVEPLDLIAVSQLAFEAPDTRSFPCLDLARNAFRMGGLAPVYLNAANEVAVAAFLQGRLAFTAIARVVETVLAQAGQQPVRDLDDIVQADQRARSLALETLER